jgi:hypothetical protein
MRSSVSTRSEKVQEGLAALSNSPIIRSYGAVRPLLVLIPV